MWNIESGNRFTVFVRPTRRLLRVTSEWTQFVLTSLRDQCNLSSNLLSIRESRSGAGTCRSNPAPAPTPSPAPSAATTPWLTSGASGRPSTLPAIGLGWVWWTAASTPWAARRDPRTTARWRGEAARHVLSRAFDMRETSWMGCHSTSRSSRDFAGSRLRLIIQQHGLPFKDVLRHTLREWQVLQRPAASANEEGNSNVVTDLLQSVN